MADLSPESFDKLAEGIKENQEIAQTYLLNKRGGQGKKTEIPESNA